MVRRLISILVGCAMLSLAVGACSESPDGPSGLDSCGELADLYVAAHQRAVDDVERADPTIPDGVDGDNSGSIKVETWWTGNN